MRSDARQRWEASRPKQPPFETPCIAPWVALEFEPSGWVSACCSSLLYPLGRIGRQRIGELWDGPRARVLKDALRRGDLTVACQPCRFHLESGRMDPVASAYDHYPLADDAPAWPHMMLFALSNRCNLGCVMCTPELSSTLRHQAGMDPLPSPYDDRFFEDLEPFLPHLGVAKFLGGEPFLAPEHHRVWALLDRLATPPLVSVTTNGTVWTDTVEWVLDRFETDISVSVDAATPETYAAVRRGGDLRDVWRNLDRFAEVCRTKGRNLHVSYCLMQSNWHELAPFLVWAEAYTFGAPVFVNLVTDAGHALHDLPTPRLEEVRAAWADDDRRLGDRMERNAPIWRTQLEQLDAVLAERRRGGGPRPTRAHEADPSVLAVGPVPAASEPAPGPPTSRAAVDEQHARLVAWSGGGEVAELELDRGGIVTAVRRPHGRLGLDSSLVGHPDTALLERMCAATGRRAWAIDRAELDDHEVRSVILATEAPVRGVPGTIVRSVHLPAADGGRTVLVAEDRIWDLDGSIGPVGATGPARPDDATPISVATPTRRAAPPADPARRSTA